MEETYQCPHIILPLYIYSDVSVFLLHILHACMINQMRKRKSARLALRNVDKNTTQSKKKKMNVRKKARIEDEVSVAGGAETTHAAMTGVPRDDTNVDKNTTQSKKKKMNVREKARIADEVSVAGGAETTHAAMTGVPRDDTTVHATCWWSDWREPVDANKCRDFSTASFGKGNKTPLFPCGCYIVILGLKQLQISIFA